MNLHRTSGKPDWADVSPGAQNGWQRLAAHTNGVCTPGNLLTIVGFLAVLAGLFLVLNHHYLAGLIIIIIGRLGDILDGMAADKTGTKSPLGEALDAGFDKLASLAALIGLIISHTFGFTVAIILLIPNLLNALFTVIGTRRSIAVHPSKTGKLFMAVSWVTVSGYIILAAVHQSAFSALGWIINVCLTVTLILGLRASYGYAQVVYRRS